MEDFIKKSDETIPFEYSDFERLKNYQSALIDLLIYKESEVEKSKYNYFRTFLMAEIQAVERYLKTKGEFIKVTLTNYHSEPINHNYFK